MKLYPYIRAQTGSYLHPITPLPAPLWLPQHWDVSNMHKNMFFQQTQHTLAIFAGSKILALLLEIWLFFGLIKDLAALAIVEWTKPFCGLIAKVIYYSKLR